MALPIKFRRFFSTDSAKAVKANAFGYLNAINYMAPANDAGVGNLCSHHTPGCYDPCLARWSGQASMRKEGEDNATTLSRKAKARYFMKERQNFMNEMAWHIASQSRTAKAHNLALCVRLNGGTDIAYERMAFIPLPWLIDAIRRIQGRSIAAKPITIMDLFPDEQFVDYTKNPLRFDKPLPRNYSLTFSRSESNEAQAIDLLRRGFNVAAIFADARPQSLWGFSVIDGDQHDLRHLDPYGVVVGLTPKGNKINRDRTGFVIRGLAAAA